MLKQQRESLMERKLMEGDGNLIGMLVELKRRKLGSIHSFISFLFHFSFFLSFLFFLINTN